MTEIPPALIARSDQMHAGCNEALDGLVNEYRKVPDLFDGDTTMAFAHLVVFIKSKADADPRDAVLVLAAAVDRLARA